MSKRILSAVITAVVLAGTLVYSTAQKPEPSEPPTPLPAQSMAGPKYWKGNLHTHSLWSDGDDYPEMIAEWYKTHGYHFLAFTEHNLLADGDKWVASESNAARKKATEKYAKRYGDAWLERRVEKEVPQVRLKPLREYKGLFEEPEKFHLIPAEELTHTFSKRPVHMNAINLRDPLKPLDGPTAEETIRVNLKLMAEQAKKTGWPMLSFLNHPNFKYGVKLEDFMGVEELQYFEVFNGHPGVANYGDVTHASTERMWDVLLAHRLGKLGLPVVYGVGTDDAHAYHEFGAGKTNPGRAWCMVHAEKLTPENIVKGMKKGDFYFTTGVASMNIVKEDGKLTVSVLAEPEVKYKVEFIATMKGVSLDGEPVKDDAGKELDVTRKYSADIGKVVQTDGGELGKHGPIFVYKFTGKELYVRAKVISDKPKANPYAKGDTEVAWTQPFQP